LFGNTSMMLKSIFSILKYPGLVCVRLEFNFMTNIWDNFSYAMFLYRNSNKTKV